MISAQNLLRRLNGNKYIAIALSIVLLSCNAFKMTSSGENEVEEVVVVVPEVKDEKRPDKVVIENEPEKEIVQTVFFFGKAYQVAAHKDNFKVALILPFYYDKSNDLERRTSSVMLDYYTGVLAAVTELEGQGIKLKLFIYDNKNDSNELKKILSKRELSNMDLIVGPIMESQMTIVSAFGLKHKIGVFSPFSSINQLGHVNKNFYSASPNLSVKAQRLVKYLEKNYRSKKLIIVRDGQSYEKEFVPVLIEELKKNGKIKFVEQAFATSTNWQGLMTVGDTTLIYMPTHQSVVVNSTLGKILATKREAVIFGENSWADFEDNDFNFWTKLSVHLLSTDYVDNGDEGVRSFRENYRSMYKIDPSIYAYLGYDQFHFIGDFLLAFGELYPGYINNKEFRYLGSAFNYAYKDGFNQNTNVFILRFKEMKLQPVQ